VIKAEFWIQSCGSDTHTHTHIYIVTTNSFKAATWKRDQLNCSM